MYCLCVLFPYSQFDLVIVNDPMDLSTQDHLHEIMMCHIMNKSKCHDLETPMLLLTDLQQFLNAASSIDVKISESASDLLKSYYAASRKVRTSISHGTDVPIGALSSMYVHLATLHPQQFAY